MLTPPHFESRALRILASYLSAAAPGVKDVTIPHTFVWVTHMLCETSIVLHFLCSTRLLLYSICAKSLLRGEADGSQQTDAGLSFCSLRTQSRSAELPTRRMEDPLPPKAKQDRIILRAAKAWESAHERWTSHLNNPPESSQQRDLAQWAQECDLLHMFVEAHERVLRRALEIADPRARQKAYSGAELQVTHWREERAKPTTTPARAQEIRFRLTQACKLRNLLNPRPVSRPSCCLACRN